MRKFFSITCILIMTIIMLLPINYGCSCYYGDWSTKKIDYNNIPEFVTEYSEEEHLERVKEIALKKLPKEYLVDVKTEILYAYYRGTPEYILITAEFAKKFSGTFTYHEKGVDYEYLYTTKYLYTVIRVYQDSHDDEYEKTSSIRTCDYPWMPQFIPEDENAFMIGPNPYLVCGYGEEYKKYYINDRFAIERNGKVMEFYRHYDVKKDSVYTLGLEPYDFSEEEISIERQKILLYNSYKSYYTHTFMFGHNEFK